MDQIKARISSGIRKTVILKAGAVTAATVVCFAGMYVWSGKKEVETNEQGQQILRRNNWGEGKRTSTLTAEIEGIKESLDITVSEEMYDAQEVRKIFSESGQTLENMILGDNVSTEEVRSNLNFAAQLPDTGIRISWDTDQHDVIDTSGNVYNEDIAEDGILVEITAYLSYAEEKSSHQFYVRVLPEKRSSSERLADELQRELLEADEETKTEGYLILPGEIDGKKVSWSPEKDNRAYAVLVIGIGTACLLCVSDKQNKKEQEKKKIVEMKRDYPRLINRLNLYIGAGMTVRRAWFCIAADYQEKKDQQGERQAYEEMVKTMNRIQSGLSEGECYEEYGIRCGLVIYRKFGTMLSQNLRKGSRGITELLRKESDEAFEERKNTAKKLGEEAGTKMMIPLFMMLAVVFAIVIIPALFSVRI